MTPLFFYCFRDSSKIFFKAWEVLIAFSPPLKPQRNQLIPMTKIITIKVKYGILNQIKHEVILMLFVALNSGALGNASFLSFAKSTLASNTPNLDWTVLFPASLPFLSKSHSLLKQLNLLQMRNILGHQFSYKTWGEIEGCKQTVL